MGRRFVIKGRKVAAIDPVVEIEERARARYIDVRAIKESDGYVVPDHVFYGPRRGAVCPPLTSAELRAAADAALESELEASIAEVKKS